MVYAISIYALSRSDRWKGGAALAKSLFILLFGGVVLIEIVSKIKGGVPPQSTIMLTFASLALVANFICFRLIWRLRNQDVNMASSGECSRNDLIANSGVLVAAVAVALTGSQWPDIIIAALIAAVFLRSAVRFITSAIPALKTA